MAANTTPIFPGKIRTEIHGLTAGVPKEVWIAGTDGSRIDKILVSTSAPSSIKVRIKNADSGIDLETIEVKGGAGTENPSEDIIQKARTWTDGDLWLAGGFTLTLTSDSTATTLLQGGDY